MVGRSEAQLVEHEGVDRGNGGGTGTATFVSHQDDYGLIDNHRTVGDSLFAHLEELHISLASP